jgi:hypothetical protein
MANQKGHDGGVNKSAVIREILAKNPKTPVKDVVASCAQRGINVHANLVYLIKSKMQHQTQRAKRQRAVEATTKAGFASPVELILEVRRLAQKTGGMGHLKELVDLLAE